MTVIKLPLKQPLGIGVWSIYDKKLEIAAKMTKYEQAFFDDLINLDNHCIYYTFTYKKLILYVICKNGK